MTNLEKFLPEILLDNFVYCTAVSRLMGTECQGRECTSCKSQLVEWLKKEYIEPIPTHDDCANCRHIEGYDTLRYCARHNQTFIGTYLSCRDFIARTETGGEMNE